MHTTSASIPVAQLRVFVPADTLPIERRRQWEGPDAPRGVTRQHAARAERRLSRTIQLGGAPRRSDLALVRRVGDQTFVCPLDLLLRVALAYDRLADRHPPVILAELVPDPQLRRRLAALARSRRPPHVRDHAFAVPVAWYAAFDPEERRHRDAPEGEGPRTRFVTRVSQAAERVKRATDALTPVAPEDDLDALEELGDWLGRFPGSALLELDYGPLATALPDHQDRAAHDLRAAVDAALRGDLLGSAAALAAARARWSGCAEQPDFS